MRFFVFLSKVASFFTLICANYPDGYEWECVDGASNNGDESARASYAKTTK